LFTKKELRKILDKLVKWRSLLAGWQLGTRSDQDPECRAVRDHREVTLLLRAEVSALTGLLVKKNIISGQEWLDALYEEAMLLDQDMEKRFPGASTSELGLHFDLTRNAEIQSWMKGWKP
jgi:hypothetical protein